MSSGTHEIINLQIGHYSNFIGTHWWNTQEASFIYTPEEAAIQKEINHDVLFREGQNLMRDITYTPRLVLVDLKGSLSTLKQDGRLYDLPDVPDDVTWAYDVTLHKGSSLPKNDFLKDLEREEAACLGDKEKEDDTEAESEIDIDVSEEQTTPPSVIVKKLYDLNGSVRVWSDYLKIHLHPRTVHTIDRYQHESDIEPFDMFGLGLATYMDRQTHDQLENQIHFFIEECDQLQGLHITTDINDGFGGLASAWLQDISDELSNTSLMVFGVSPPVFPDYTSTQDIYRAINSALAIEKLSSLGSAFVPLSLAKSMGRKPGSALEIPNVNYQVDLPYHTSAILAASLETATTPYRLEGSQSSLCHLTQAMTPYGRKILNLHSSLPFPLSQGSTVLDTLLDLGDTFPWKPMSPGCDSSTPCTAQSVVLRGLKTVRLKGVQSQDKPHVLNRCDTLDELMSLYLREMCDCSLNAICAVRQGCKTTDPFPHVFKPNVNRHGFLSSVERPKDTGVESVPMVTSLQSSTAVKPMLEELLSDVKAINIRRYHRVLECGMEEDEYKESLSNFMTIVDNYEDSGGDMV